MEPTILEQILRFFSFQDANVKYVLLGSLLLGTTSGILGSFSLLRRRSLLGDALAHAALPGVCIAFLVTGTKSILPLLVGASLSGIAGVLVMQILIKNGRIKADSAIGLVLSVFFGIGIVLLTYIQRQPMGNQSGLDKFLFGQAASMLPSDLKTIGVISLFVLFVIILFFKEFRLLTFDPAFLATLGFPVQLIDLLLMALIVLAVMVGLQAVGVVLMAAILITPAAAARMWTHKLTSMVVLAGVFGAISGFLGTFFSSLAPRIPTGPIMVLSASAFFLVSAFFAPGKGVLFLWNQHHQNKKRVAGEHVLRGYIELSEFKTRDESVSVEELVDYLKLRPNVVIKICKNLSNQGFCVIDEYNVKLTSSGYQRAVNIVKTHRLWEYYLIHRAKLKPDHVHRDADEIEHILSAEIIEELEEILHAEGVDTKQITSLHPLVQSGS